MKKIIFTSLILLTTPAMAGDKPIAKPIFFSAEETASRDRFKPTPESYMNNKPVTQESRPQIKPQPVVRRVVNKTKRVKSWSSGSPELNIVKYKGVQGD